MSSGNTGAYKDTGTLRVELLNMRMIVQMGEYRISELAGILVWYCKISPRSSHPSLQRCCIHSEFAAPGTEIRSKIPVPKSGPFPRL